ncbi:MAG: hypothetical protein WC748_06660 [Legionellales bacterium]|jgi:hypothetical protein
MNAKVYNPTLEINYFSEDDPNYAFYLWGYAIATEENKSPTQEKLKKTYKKLFPIWNDVTDILNIYFVNSTDFLYTRWHYELVKICYKGDDPSALLQMMRTHRYNHFKIPENKTNFTYQKKYNASHTLEIKKFKRKDKKLEGQLKQSLHKKWHNGTCNLNRKSIRQLETLNLLSHTRSYQELKNLIHCLENRYYQDEVNTNDLMFMYFSPCDNIIQLSKILHGEKTKLTCPDNFVAFVQKNGNTLSYKQYQGLLEYALLYPNKISFDENSQDPIRLADAYHYAYNCWKDDIELLLSNTDLTTQALKKYRYTHTIDNNFCQYIKIYETYNYLQRFCNWIADQLRWCYNHPCKVITLLILSIVFGKVLALYQPVLQLFQLISSQVTWHTPAWLEMMGSLTTARGITGLIARAILGQQHPVLFAFNKLIANNAQKTIDHINIDLTKIPDQLANFATKF